MWDSSSFIKYDTFLIKNNVLNSSIYGLNINNNK